MPDIIQINTPGPRGSAGPVGPKGEPGALTAYEDLIVTGSLYVSGTINEGHITGSGINARFISASSGISGSLTGSLNLLNTKSDLTKVPGAIISRSSVLMPTYQPNGGGLNIEGNNFPHFSFDQINNTSGLYCSPLKIRNVANGGTFIEIGRRIYNPGPGHSNFLRFQLFESQSTGTPFFEIYIPPYNDLAPNSRVTIGRDARNLTNAETTSSLLRVGGGFYSNFLTGPNAQVALPNVSASGYLSASKADIVGNTTVGGNVTANLYYGDGSNLTGIGSNPFPFIGDAEVRGNISASGEMSASVYYGDGSNLSGIGSNPFPFTGDADVNGNVSASAYYGDGSNLIGVQADGFPFSGSALITGSLTVSGSEDTSISASGDISASAFHGNGQYLSGIGSNPFPYTGDAEIQGSITGSGFLSDGVGVPTLASDSNIHLEAKNGAVVITTSSLRLNSFTDAQTSSVVFSAGDIYFNSTGNNFMGYNGTSHVILG